MPSTTPSRRFLPPDQASHKKDKHGATPSDSRIGIIAIQPGLKRKQVLRGDAGDQFAIVPQFHKKDQFVPAPHYKKRSQFSGTPRFKHENTFDHHDERREPTSDTLEYTKPLADECDSKAADEGRSRSISPEIADSADGNDSEGDLLLEQAPLLMPDNGQDQWKQGLPLSPKHPVEAENISKHISRPIHASSAFLMPRMTIQSPGRFQSMPVFAATQQARPAMPSFMLPPESTAVVDDNNPLPEAFSPHRRGPNMVPGGMAETLLKWTTEKSSIMFTHGGAESFSARLTLTDVSVQSTSLIKMVQGTTSDSGQVSVMLIRDIRTDQQSRDRGLDEGRHFLRRGQIIGLKEPCWTVEVDEKPWLVCVDWKVLGP